MSIHMEDSYIHYLQKVPGNRHLRKKHHMKMDKQQHENRDQGFNPKFRLTYLGM